MAMGSGVWLGVLRKSERSNCPNETMKARGAPAVMPDLMLGTVTVRNAFNGPAPKLRAASSSERSKP